MPSILAENTNSPEFPTGVIAVAVAFFLSAVYLGILGLLMLVNPEAVSMRLGAPLLEGLELAGPYMFLVTAAVAALVGYGLLRRNQWARRASVAIVLLGLIMLVPDVSSAVIEYRWAKLAMAGIGVMARVIIVWYLYQEPVKESFR